MPQETTENAMLQGHTREQVSNTCLMKDEAITGTGS